ncbi:MAG TPA: hypothetical protein VFQ91_12445 [Bryobacteraceae bacterium]|nr:hypothetical protein [Bryobacteraceae bacterium]
MRLAPSPFRRFSRRKALGLAAGIPLLAGAKGQESPGEAKKFLDATTEFEVLRVTALSHNAWLPLASDRALTRRGDALLFASDASGAPQLYRHDFKGNKIRQLTEAAALNTNTFTWTAGDRGFCYLDGRKVMQSGAGRDRVLYEWPADWGESPRLAAAEDGTMLAISAYNGTKTKLVLLGKTALPLEERTGDIGTLCVRPKRPGVSYVGGGELRLSRLDGKALVTLRTAPGEVLSAYWTADGASLLYLLRPDADAKRTEIREIVPESGVEALVAKTTQYGHFQRNGDASVFLGASLSVASPHILLLLRSVKRELTICEHRCSDARLTRAVFAANSSRIAFQTDRHGKMTIYAMAVDRLVEETEDNT